MTDTMSMSMSSPDEFSKNLYEVAEQKILWLDSVALPKVLEEYRNYHSIIKNLISMLLKKRLIDTDPYKYEKKIIDITVPDSSDFKDSENVAIFGMRLSEYETSLDFLCNYVGFTVESLSLDRIKKLAQMNSFILWASLSSAGTRANSRALSVIFSSIRMSADTLSTGLINNITSVAVKSIDTITTELKVLTEIQKELYKIEVRKAILDAPVFSSIRDSLTLENGVSQIKKVFPALLRKKSFYPDLIRELVQEEVGPDKDSLRQAVMNKFGVIAQKSEKKIVDVDTKSILLNAIRIFGAFSSQFDAVLQKIGENHLLLQSEHSGAWEKFLSTCRKAVGLHEKTIEYKIKVTEPFSQVVKSETLDYSNFIDSLAQLSHLYANMGAKTSPVYKKIEKQTNTAILDYVQKKISECQFLYVTLVGLDEFFKSEVSVMNRSKVKGLGMELTSIKNTIVVANHRKVEYVSLVAEQDQMKKLGITNE